VPAADDQAALIMPTALEPTAGQVRCWLRKALTGVPLLPRLQVALVAEELVANARVHARAPYVLQLSIEGGALWVQVDDCSPDSPQEWGPGSGLVLVAGLSRDWGVERRRRAKTVWAEVALGFGGVGLAAPPQPGRGGR
jgi:hypothetical protein